MGGPLYGERGPIPSIAGPLYGKRGPVPPISGPIRLIAGPLYGERGPVSCVDFDVLRVYWYNEEYLYLHGVNIMQNPQRQLGRPRKDGNEISTKDTILQIATVLFLERGYPLISMDDVAKQADVTKATVYYHYKTKDDLFTDALVQLMARITGGINKIFSTDQSLKKQLFTLAKVHLEATAGMDVNLFMKEARHSLSAEHEQLLVEAEDNMYRALEHRIQQSIDKGEIPHSNAYLASLLFMSMLMIGKNNEKSFKSLDDLVTQTVDFFWHGLANQS